MGVRSLVFRPAAGLLLAGRSGAPGAAAQPILDVLTPVGTRPIDMARRHAWLEAVWMAP